MVFRERHIKYKQTAPVSGNKDQGGQNYPNRPEQVSRRQMLKIKFGGEGSKMPGSSPVQKVSFVKSFSHILTYRQPLLIPTH